MSLIETRKSKTGKVTYRAKVRISGYPEASATFDRKTDAQIWAKQTETEIRNGKYFNTLEAKRHTLSEAIDRYIKDVLPHRNSDHQKFKTHLAWWKEQLGAYSLVNITSSRLAGCRDNLASSLSARKTPMSPATVNRYIATLSIVLSCAVEWEWVDENPIKKIRKLSESKGRTRFLDQDEIARLLAECKKSKNKYLYPIVVLALATGARQSEITYLTWNDIDFQHHQMRLEKTKNGEKRTVPITDLAWIVIEELARVRRLKTNLLFPNQAGNKPIDFRDAWEGALDRANIKNFRFHDLRHTTASNLAMNGASLLEIAEILGHKTLAMVQRYSHLTQKYTHSVLEKMNQQQFQAVSI